MRAGGTLHDAPILRLEPDFGAHADGLGGGEAEVVDGVGGVVGDGEEESFLPCRHGVFGGSDDHDAGEEVGDVFYLFGVEQALVDGEGQGGGHVGSSLNPNAAWRWRMPSAV